tara:strand:- start:9584 stop:10174 length:591 start_codon:yes stop_codon:yes gene_type:complete
MPNLNELKATTSMVRTDMLDLMIDLETYGTKNDAAVASIGACFFDPLTGEIGEKFHCIAKFDTVPEEGMEESTMKWWATQSEDARKSLSSGSTHYNDMLSMFYTWVKDNANLNSVKPWGNGSIFDMVILESAFKSIDMNAPWKFWNVRDVRTIADLGMHVKVNYKDEPFTGIRHNALADAEHQAMYVSKIIGRLLS